LSDSDFEKADEFVTKAEICLVEDDAIGAESFVQKASTFMNSAESADKIAETGKKMNLFLYSFHGMQRIKT